MENHSKSTKVSLNSYQNLGRAHETITCPVGLRPPPPPAMSGVPGYHQERGVLKDARDAGIFEKGAKDMLPELLHQRRGAQPLGSPAEWRIAAGSIVYRA